jgi:3-hydroxyisobutyrate dehydrogenase-like beta-hydroxyacid dehydrogenase
MGMAMARNLVQAGFQVAGYARRPEVGARAQELGIEIRATLAEVAADREFLVTMVTSSPDVVEVTTGDGGLLSTAPRGSVLIDMSTVSPETSRAVAAGAGGRGVDFLDAPVSGGSFGAEAGTLTIMVGGDAALLEACRPLFAAVGDPARIFHAGPVGSGEVVKLVNNMLVGAISAATLEAMLVGVRAGVPLQTLVDVVSVSSGASAQLVGQLAPRAFKGRFEPGFSTDLLVKDLRLAAEVAAVSGQSTPLTDLARRQFERAQRAGHGPQDYTALALELEKETGVVLRLE